MKMRRLLDKFLMVFFSFARLLDNEMSVWTPNNRLPTNRSSSYNKTIEFRWILLHFYGKNNKRRTNKRTNNDNNNANEKNCMRLTYTHLLFYFIFFSGRILFFFSDCVCVSSFCLFSAALFHMFTSSFCICEYEPHCYELDLPLYNINTHTHTYT